MFKSLISRTSRLTRPSSLSLSFSTAKQTPIQTSKKQAPNPTKTLPTPTNRPHPLSPPILTSLTTVYQTIGIFVSKIAFFPQFPTQFPTKMPHLLRVKQSTLTKLKKQPPLILLGWTLFGWGSEQEQSQHIIDPNTINDPNVPTLEQGSRRRKVVRFEKKSENSEKIPSPPSRDRTKLDEYGISVNNIFRYCNDSRLHQKFQVNYVEGDVHHNINEYRTFIEKERYYLQKDYNQIVLLQNVYIRRLLQLHYLLGLKLEKEGMYKEQFKAKILEDMLFQKRINLNNELEKFRINFANLEQNNKFEFEKARKEIYEKFPVQITQEELDAIDIDLFGEIRESKLMPFRFQNGRIIDLLPNGEPVENYKNLNQHFNHKNDQDNNPQINPDAQTPFPMDPNKIVNDDGTESYIIHNPDFVNEFLLEQEQKSFSEDLLSFEKDLKIPQKITTPKPKIFTQPTPGNLNLLPPDTLDWLEQVRGSVLFSMRSIEELGQALYTLNATLEAFDSMVQDSLDTQEYLQEMNLLACQAAFITGTRQVVHNVLRHSNDVVCLSFVCFFFLILLCLSHFSFVLSSSLSLPLHFL